MDGSARRFPHIMSRLRVGTVEGLVEPPGGVTIPGPTRVFGDAALGADGRVLWYSHDGWAELARGPDLLCAVDAPGGLLIGTGKHLVQVGTEGWPAWRLRRGGARRLVRRGVVSPRPVRWPSPTTASCWPASTSAGSRVPTTWVGPGRRRSTLPPTCTRCRLPGRPDVVLAAGVGCCRSDDGGVTWRVMADGLRDVLPRRGGGGWHARRQRIRDREAGGSALPPRLGDHTVQARDRLDRRQRRHRARRARRPGRSELGVASSGSRTTPAPPGRSSSASSRPSPPSAPP